MLYFLGNEILNRERKLEIAKSRNDYDTCIKLRRELEDLRKQRDNFDAIYETSRYEKMIIMKYLYNLYIYNFLGGQPQLIC